MIDKQCPVAGQRGDRRPQRREAVERITKHGGYVLYMRQEGRGIGLYDKRAAVPHRHAGPAHPGTGGR